MKYDLETMVTVDNARGCVKTNLKNHVVKTVILYIENCAAING